MSERPGDERFFELSLDLAAVIGFDGRFRRLNEAWEDTLGWTTEELMARPYADFFHEEDRDRALAEAARLTEPGTATRDFELRVATRDGGWRWLLISARGVPEEEAIYTVAKDITERKRSQEVLEAQLAVDRVLVESPPIEEGMARVLAALGDSMGWTAGGYWELDEDEDLLSCKAFWAAEHERTREFEARTLELRLPRGTGLPGRVVQSGEAAWVPDIGSDPNHPRADVSDAAGLTGAVGVPVTSAAGQVIAVLDFFTARPLPEPDDELIAMMATISAQVGQYLRRKRAEVALESTAAELRRRATDLERSNAELEQFAYVASHDLSEPLRMISGFVQLLSERYTGRLDSDADEFIAYTIDGVQRMQGLIDDLLAYSRVGRAVEDAPVELDEIVADARTALRAPIEETGAEIEVGPLPVVVGDRRELTQLFQNLLSNAVKFVRSGPPRVQVTARRVDGEWEMLVRDNGIGIDPRHAERVFKMFQRLHGREEYPGTGIGLAICKKIAERHGGDIDVTAAAGGGSEFRVTLPVRDPLP
ncbi:MAG TPA: ATP-binding protein [Solirubrobacteraceae bacterium]|nr:ATP-binding protein [Solirubrobacteraceae bacterium]